jgi:chromosome segregation ATPase
MGAKQNMRLGAQLIASEDKVAETGRQLIEITAQLSAAQQQFALASQRADGFERRLAEQAQRSAQQGTAWDIASAEHAASLNEARRAAGDQAAALQAMIERQSSDIKRLESEFAALIRARQADAVAHAAALQAQADDFSATIATLEHEVSERSREASVAEEECRALEQRLGEALESHDTLSAAHAELSQQAELLGTELAATRQQGGQRRGIIRESCRLYSVSMYFVCSGGDSR